MTGGAFRSKFSSHGNSTPRNPPITFCPGFQLAPTLLEDSMLSCVVPPPSLLFAIDASLNNHWP